LLTIEFYGNIHPEAEVFYGRIVAILHRVLGLVIYIMARPILSITIDNTCVLIPE